jgi:hypothetical protein
MNTTTVVFGNGSIFDLLALDPTLKPQLAGLEEPMIRALAERGDLQPLASAVEDRVATGSIPLLIRGTKYHLRAKQTGEATLLEALKAITQMYWLDEQNLLVSGIQFSAKMIQTVLNKLTRLSAEQSQILHDIIALKRTYTVTGRWPTTEEIAQMSGRSRADLEENLTPLVDKVVRYDQGRDSWVVVF